MSNCRHRLGPSRLCVILFAVLATTVVLSQPQQPGTPIFRTGPEQTEVSAITCHRDGRFVSDLTIEDFKLFEGDKRQQLYNVAPPSMVQEAWTFLQLLTKAMELLLMCATVTSLTWSHGLKLVWGSIEDYYDFRRRWDEKREARDKARRQEADPDKAASERDEAAREELEQRTER